MATRKPTILDIARKMNVTPSTVSRALNGNGRISQRTIDEVRRVADELNYQRNQVASSLRSGETRVIGVMLPTIDRYFFGSVVRSIEQVARENGYTVMMTQSNEDPALERENLEAMLSAQVSGIIASVGLNLDDHAVYEEVTKRGIPLVLFDRISERVTSSRVTIDDYRGAYLATEHLIQQGCRQLVHLAGEKNINIYHDRLRGFKDAMQAHQLPFDPARSVIRSLMTVEAGREHMARRLRQDPPVDGLFSASDWGAVGAMTACQDAGLRVPEDIAVIGFANEPFTEFLSPSLSSVDQQSQEIGLQAAREFLRLSGSDDQLAPRHIVLEPGLIIRASSSRQPSA